MEEEKEEEREEEVTEFQSADGDAFSLVRQSTVVALIQLLLILNLLRPADPAPSVLLH